jgi:putative salt-induced outer membrane protein
MSKMFVAALAAAGCLALPALAEPLPAGVEAMIREAAKGDDLPTVVKIAKAASPRSTAEIDALVASLKAEAAAAREAKLARAGILDAWSGSGQLGFSATSGNSHDTGITVGVTLMKDGLKFRHKLTGIADRQTSAGLLTRNRYLANYELDYKITDRLYAYGLGGWERDPFAGFTRRFSESAGAGYSVLKTDTLILDVTAGPAFRQTRFVTGPNASQTTARGALDFNWKIFDKVVFTEDAAIYLNSQWTSTTALTGALGSKLSARLSFDVTHEDKPRAGRKATDTATRASLVYGF